MIERNFEALVYTRDRAVASAAAAAFAELPIDWTLVDHPGECQRLYAKRGCDFVVIDADSGDAAAFLTAAAEPSQRLEAVVLVLSANSADPALLHRSYDAGFFYPVKPADLGAMLATVVPLAEHRAMEQDAAARAAAAAKDADPVAEGLTIPIPALLAAGWRALRRVTRSIGANAVRHSLSVIVQERAASLLSAVGTAWYVQEITQDFRAVGFIDPPTAGPMYLVAISLLLWLCAKHRRALGEGAAGAALAQSATA